MVGLVDLPSGAAILSGGALSLVGWVLGAGADGVHPRRLSKPGTRRRGR